MPLVGQIPVKVATGAAYVYLSTDFSTVIARSNSGSPMSDTLWTIDATAFPIGFALTVKNEDASASLTLNGVLDVGASVVLAPGQSCQLATGASKIFVLSGAGSGGTGTVSFINVAKWLVD